MGRPKKDPAQMIDFDFPPLTAKTLNDNGVKNLLAAVAADAAKSWRRCVKMITDGYQSRAIYNEKRRVEEFFLGEEFHWMGMGVDGEAVLQRLNHEFGIDQLEGKQKLKYDAMYNLRKKKDPVKSFNDKKYRERKKAKKLNGV